MNEGHIAEQNIINDGRIIVGVVGPAASGKDSAVLHLVSAYGFVHVSTTEIVRDYILKQGISNPSRPIFIKYANEARAKYGGDYTVVEALKNKADRLAVSGLRATAEAETLKKNGGIIIAVTAPQRLRYARGSARGSGKDNDSFEKFAEIENKEMSGGNPNVQNVAGVMALADYTIQNTGTLEELYASLDAVIENII